MYIGNQFLFLQIRKGVLSTYNRSNLLRRQINGKIWKLYVKKNLYFKGFY